jgi:DNA-binding transcriptional regulator/RsmH inhibitor MraZ
VLFTGYAEATFDAKQRLSIPAKYRRTANAGGQTAGQGSGQGSGQGAGQGEIQGVWYCFPWPKDIIRIYPEQTFERLAGVGSPTLFPNEDEAEFAAAFFGSVERVEMDSAGRVILPRPMVQMANLSGEVVIVGARDRLEVRDKAAWLAGAAQRLAQLPSLLSRIESRKAEAARHIDPGPLRGGPLQ